MKTRIKKDSNLKTCPNGFTIVELLIVALLGIMIIGAIYKIFTYQVRVVATSMEVMKVNDDFRKIQMYLGNDIREATKIIFPPPIKLEESANLVTPKAPCTVLHLVKQEINPSLIFSFPEPETIKPASIYGQIEKVSEIKYELRPYKKKDDEDMPDTAVPRFRLFRIVTSPNPSNPNTTFIREDEVTDTIRDFVIFRTIRKPMRPLNVEKLSDKILEVLPSNEAGTGPDLLHLRVTLERLRQNNPGEVYSISLATSYYKRGREVFYNQ